MLIAAICLTLIAAGGLSGLQAASVLSALPFTFILYGMVIVLVRELRADRRAMLTQLYRRHGETPVGADAFEADQLAEEAAAPGSQRGQSAHQSPRRHLVAGPTAAEVVSSGYKW